MDMMKGSEEDFLRELLLPLRKLQASYTIEKIVGVLSPFNHRDYEARATNRYLLQLQDFGGVKKIISRTLPTDSDFSVSVGWLEEQAQALIVRPDFAKGTTLSGHPFQLDSDQACALVARRADHFSLKTRELTLRLFDGNYFSKPATWQRDRKRKIKRLFESQLRQAFEQDDSVVLMASVLSVL
jgi:hypothetical protein